MLVTTERPTARLIASRAWASLFQAARRLAPLFLGSLVLLIVITTRLLIPGYQNWVVQLSKGPLGSWADLTLATVFALLSIVVLAPLAVAVHRFVLLGEVRNSPLYNQTSIRFAALLALLQIAQLLGSLLRSQIIRPLVLLYVVVWWTVIGWTVLAFPSVAVEEAAIGGGLLDATVERTKGNFWLILCSLLLTVLPLSMLWALLMLVYEMSVMALLRAGIPQFVLSSCFVLIKNGIAVALVGLGATTASWLYSYAANQPARANA